MTESKVNNLPAKTVTSLMKLQFGNDVVAETYRGRKSIKRIRDLVSVNLGTGSTWTEAMRDAYKRAGILNSSDAQKYRERLSK